MPDSFCHDVIYFFHREGYNKKKAEDRWEYGADYRL